MNSVSMTLECHAAYQVAMEKLAKLQKLEGEQTRKVEELGSKLHGAARTLEREVEALLAGNEFSEEGRHEELREEEYRLTVIRRAVATQRQIADREARQASVKICEQLRPEHRRVVGNIAAALIALGEALEEEADFRSQLDAAGVSFSGILRPMPINALGQPRDPDGAIIRWLYEAVEHGLIAEKVVPEEWKRRARVISAAGR